MATFYNEGMKISFEGIRGVIIKITETYRKNVLVVKVSDISPRNKYCGNGTATVGIFEYPDGHLEFMSIID